jgi:hypothetical protein
VESANPLQGRTHGMLIEFLLIILVIEMLKLIRRSLFESGSHIDAQWEFISRMKDCFV